MSVFSKLFKLFLAVVFFPLIPLVFLLGYYQVHLKDTLLDTHANLAEMVASSMSQHMEDLTWRLAFAPQLSEALNHGQNPVALLKTELASNPDFLMLAVLSDKGIERYRAGTDPLLLKKIGPLHLQNNPALLPKEPRLLVSHFSVVDGRPITEFLYPLENGNFLYGILSFWSFLSRVQQQRIGQTGHVYIVSQDGYVFADEYAYTPPFEAATFRHYFDTSSPLIKHIDAAGQTYVGAYAATPILGVNVAVLQLRAEAYRGIYHTNIILLLFLLTIATLAYFGALVFAERVGEPIEALSQAANQISQGNLDVHVDPEIGWGEFQRLINAFNQMTADLKDYQTLRLQAQLSEMKEHVFRAVAHDLRAPLMGLQGYIYILQKGNVSNEEKAHYLTLMAEAAQNLSELLEDVLDVSRLEAGIAHVQKQSVDMHALVEEVLNTLRPGAAQKHLSLTAQVDVDRLPADPKSVKRIVTNLVSNAIKFTEKGFVKVIVSQTKKSYSVKVQDSGIGLTEQEIKGLFQKYHQVSSDKPGFGLGLFISLQLAQAHGGTISVTSKPGKGSTFTLQLPKEQV